jgi:hypothetical protein
MIGRREFITLIGGAAAAWPLMARAQQNSRVRRVGVLIAVTEEEFERRFKPFREALAQLGWMEPRNLRIDYRWTGNNRDVERVRATELLDLAPEVIFAAPGPMVEILQRLTRDVPIVFSTNTDPVAAGYVQSYAHPGGNITGFTQVEGTVVTRWLQLLKDIAPYLERVGVLRPAGLARGRRDIDAMKAAAELLAVKPVDLLLVRAGEGAMNEAAGSSVSQMSLGESRAAGSLCRHPALCWNIGQQSSGLPKGTTCRRSTTIAFLRTRAALCPMGLINWMCSGGRPPTSIAFYAARSRAICRCRLRRNTSLSLISEPQSCWDSRSRVTSC